MKRLLIFSALVFLVWLTEVAGATSQPNIVFLLTDDQRSDTIAALGNPHIETPNLDALVRRGTVFTRAHAENPICVASRAAILTGCRNFTKGAMLGNGPNLSLAVWPEVMHNAGYHTWYVGKWHTPGRPSIHGYSETLGLFGAGGGRHWKEQSDFKGIPVTGYRGWVFQDDKGTIFPEAGVGLTGNISARFADAAIAVNLATVAR